MVTFSEHTYWPVHGYDLLGPALFYVPPSFVCLWAVEFFRVRRLAPLFLCGALYGFVVEGIITPAMYEDGLLGWFHMSYTPLAWHAPLSVMLGWYGLRKLLVSGRVLRLVALCAAFGVFWGCWSLVQ